MNNENRAALGKKLLSGPYLFWMVGFTLIPLALIFWYGITDKSGAFTLQKDVYKRQELYPGAGAHEAGASDLRHRAAQALRRKNSAKGKGLTHGRTD